LSSFNILQRDLASDLQYQDRAPIWNLCITSVPSASSLVTLEWSAASPPPVRKASGSPSSPRLFGGYAAEAKPLLILGERPENLRLSARKAAKPHDETF